MKNLLFIFICVVAVAAASTDLVDTETSEAMAFLPLLFTPQSKRRLLVFLRQKTEIGKSQHFNFWKSNSRRNSFFMFATCASNEC